MSSPEDLCRGCSLCAGRPVGRIENKKVRVGNCKVVLSLWEEVAWERGGGDPACPLASTHASPPKYHKEVSRQLALRSPSFGGWRPGVRVLAWSGREKGLIPSLWSSPSSCVPTS